MVPTRCKDKSRAKNADLGGVFSLIYGNILLADYEHFDKFDDDLDDKFDYQIAHSNYPLFANTVTVVKLFHVVCIRDDHPIFDPFCGCRLIAVYRVGTKFCGAVDGCIKAGAWDAGTGGTAHDWSRYECARMRGDDPGGRPRATPQYIVLIIQAKLNKFENN